MSEDCIKDKFDNVSEILDDLKTSDLFKTVIPHSTEHSKSLYKAWLNEPEAPFLKMELLMTITTILQEYKSLSGNDYRWLSTYISQETYKNKYEKDAEKSHYGVLVFLFVQMGLSQNKSINFISDVYCVSRTKVRDAYYQKKKIDLLPVMILYRNFSSVLSCQEQVNKHLKKDSDESKAFEKLISACKLIYKYFAIKDYFEVDEPYPLSDVKQIELLEEVFTQQEVSQKGDLYKNFPELFKTS